MYRWFLVAAVVLTVAYMVIDWYTRRRLNDLIAEMEKWRHLPMEERFVKHTEYTELVTRQQATLARVAALFAVGVIAAGALMFGWIGQTVDRNDRHIEDNCRSFHELTALIVKAEAHEDSETLDEDLSRFEADLNCPI